jgi:hypothetical protein
MPVLAALKVRQICVAGNRLLKNAISLLFTLRNLRPVFRAASSNHSPHRSEAKLFGIEFSDLHVSKEDSVVSRCDQLESQFLEAKYFADEDPVLVPTDVSGVVHMEHLEVLLHKGSVTDGNGALENTTRGYNRHGKVHSPSVTETLPNACRSHAIR